MHLLRSYFNYVNEPEQALWALLEERSVAQACVGYLAATLGWVLFFNIGDGVSFPILLLKIAIVFVTELTAGCFLSAFCGLFLDFLEVKTSPVKLFVLIGSAGFIKGLLIAFALISAAVPSANLVWLSPLAVIVVFALQLGYLVRGLKRAYGVSYFKATLAWIMACVPVFVTMVLLGVFFVWSIGLLIA